MKSTLALVMLMASLNSFAEGSGGGNGGDALVCPDSVVLLDYFEARKNELDIQFPEGSLRTKTDAVVKRLARVDVPKSERLGSYLNDMVTDLEMKAQNPKYKMKVMKMSKGVTLVDIDDSKELVLPSGCVKKQLVIQKETVLAEDRLYEVDKDLWDQMSLDQQAMTLTHEAFYRMNILAGALDSRFARSLNGVFNATESESMNLTDYLSRLQNATTYSAFAPGSGPFRYEAKIHGKNFQFQIPQHLYHGVDVSMKTAISPWEKMEKTVNIQNVAQTEVDSASFNQDFEVLSLKGRPNNFLMKNIKIVDFSCGLDQNFVNPAVKLDCSVVYTFWDKKLYTTEKTKKQVRNWWGDTPVPRFHLSFDLVNSEATNVKISK